MDVAHPVSSLDRPTEDTAKGIKSPAWGTAWQCAPAVGP